MLLLILCICIQDARSSSFIYKENDFLWARSQFLIRNLFSWLDFITLSYTFVSFECDSDSNEWLCLFHQFHLSSFLSESMREMTGNYLEATSSFCDAIVVATALEWKIELRCHENWVIQYYCMNVWSHFEMFAKKIKIFPEKQNPKVRALKRTYKTLATTNR